MKTLARLSIVVVMGVLAGRPGATGAAPSVEPLGEGRARASLDPTHQPVADGAVVALGKAHVGRDGLHAADVSIALAAFGRDGALAGAETHAPEIVGPEVRIRRAPGVVEWWRSLAVGIEQGVTLDSRPGGDGPLVLEMSVGDGVMPEGRGESIALRDARGATRATYSGLAVIDANGAQVPAQMAAAGRRIRIEVDDENAAYPLVVDPIVAVLEHLGSSTIVDMSYAASAAVAIGGTFGAMTAEVLSHSTGMWPATPLSSTDVRSAGISGDAMRVAVAATCAGPSSCIQFFVRSGGWTLEGTLPGSGSIVRLDQAGTRAFAFDPNPSPPVVHVFARTGSSWELQASVPVSCSGTGDTFAVSGDGSHFLRSSYVAGHPSTCLYGLGADGETWLSELTRGAVGGAFDTTGTHVTIGDSLYVRSGATWSVEIPLPAAAATSGALGTSMTADGSRIAVRRFGGGGEIYSRAGSSWVVETAYLDPLGPLSGDGSHFYVNQRIYDVRGAVGTSCTSNGMCTNNRCVDGYCCESACGGGVATDCQACAMASTGAANGSCRPALPSTVCRAAASSCDVAEMCTGTATSCPADTFAAASVVCRPASRSCDRPEMCTGSSAACPTDVPLPGSTVCRPAVGSCDREELCDGTSFDCAADSALPAGVPCGSGGTSCSTPGACNGISRECAGGTPLAATTVCRPADPTNPCDVDDHCSGTGDVCVLEYAEPTTACGNPPSGECDAPDHCSGTSGDCVDTFLSGAVCRTPAGSCDVAETCSGTSPVCPPDGLLAAGISCRPSTDVCDPEEVCDGTSAMCPRDLDCTPDAAGTADAGAIDAGAIDAGRPPVAAAGCACAAHTGRLPHHLGLAVALAVLVALRRRRPPAS